MFSNNLENGEKFPSIESTQLYLKEKLESHPNLPHGYYVTAGIQTGGRGRGDRVWESYEGNLHVSILLRKFPFSEITWLPHWVSVCVLQALISLGVDDTLIQLKWPNDLWVERSKKIAGILCEKRGDTMIAGIGLNLIKAPSTDAGVVPSEAILNVNQVLERVLHFLSEPMSLSELQLIYEKNSLFIVGDSIEWQKDSVGSKIAKKMEGRIVGLGIHGELIVESEGMKIPLFTEDVRAVRLV